MAIEEQSCSRINYIYTYAELYWGSMTQWSAKDILEEIDKENLDSILNLANTRIKFLKKIRKIME